MRKKHVTVAFPVFPTLASFEFGETCIRNCVTLIVA